eukprot:CAMPEP_0168219192 /NCGR_PEP_ID=MMETSP0140_2-20121125/8400_1 /TAXON_ID=44445 /ORGANISM="Pseudo-nitzschia australis, Strain 10249 10 AB" /LENGTH=142 /DNA_ID=CAMNT_0008147499 /DNA_START=209 /DNA_END=637 /DNA_ORIENTATION=-
MAPIDTNTDTATDASTNIRTSHPIMVGARHKDTDTMMEIPSAFLTFARDYQSPPSIEDIESDNEKDAAILLLPKNATVINTTKKTKKNCKLRPWRRRKNRSKEESKSNPNPGEKPKERKDRKKNRRTFVAARHSFVKRAVCC